MDSDICRVWSLSSSLVLLLFETFCFFCSDGRVAGLMVAVPEAVERTPFDFRSFDEHSA